MFALDYGRLMGDPIFDPIYLPVSASRIRPKKTSPSRRGACLAVNLLFPHQGEVTAVVKLKSDGVTMVLPALSRTELLTVTV